MGAWRDGSVIRDHSQSTLSGPAWVYYSVFNFWGRWTLVQESRGTRAWKACIIVSVLQCLFVFGLYLLAEAWFGLGPPPQWATLVVIAAIGIPNFDPKRRRAWEAFDEEFSSSGPQVRRRSLGTGGVISFSVIGFYLAAIWVFRGWK